MYSTCHRHVNTEATYTGRSVKSGSPRALLRCFEMHAYTVCTCFFVFSPFAYRLFTLTIPLRSYAWLTYQRSEPMDRKEVIRNYAWRSLHARVRQWYESRRVPIVEAPVANIEKGFGMEHCIPRVSTHLVKLRYEREVAFVLLLAPATLRVSLTSICKTYRASTAWMATLGEVHHLTRSVPGCVPAFGSLFDLPVTIDARLRHAPELFAPSGQPGFAVRIPMLEFIASENPQFIDMMRRSTFAAANPFDQSLVRATA